MPDALLLLSEMGLFDLSIGRVQRLKLGGSTDKHLTGAFDRSSSSFSFGVSPISDVPKSQRGMPPIPHATGMAWYRSTPREMGETYRIEIAIDGGCRILQRQFLMWHLNRHLVFWPFIKCEGEAHVSKDSICSFSLGVGIQFLALPCLYIPS